MLSSDYTDATHWPTNRLDVNVSTVMELHIGVSSQSRLRTRWLNSLGCSWACLLGGGAIAHGEKRTNADVLVRQKRVQVGSLSHHEAFCLFLQD